MNEKIFWELISRLDWDKSGDDAVVEPVVDALAAMELEAIFRFQDILSEKLFALDTRAHCKACYAGELDPDNGDDYISPDDFLYCRCVVVANGKKFYETVLKNPGKMPQGLEFEWLLSLTPKAYEKKVGEEIDHVSPISYESFQNAAGWAKTSAIKPGKYTGANIPPGNRRPT